MNKIFAILLATSLVGGAGYAKNMDLSLIHISSPRD